MVFDTLRLGVNIDHVATLRQQRCEGDPDVLAAARSALSAGADGITVHLREDRRHIQLEDVQGLIPIVPALNLEMAPDDEMVAIACQLKPRYVCLVPEKRCELTTEGGLDVVSHQHRLTDVVAALHQAGIIVSLFIDPDIRQAQAAHHTGADFIEIHTGDYSRSPSPLNLKAIAATASYAVLLGLKVNAGHGLNYQNVKPIVQIPQIQELNIGHSIVSRAVFVGLSVAVAEMRQLLYRPFQTTDISAL